MIDIQNVSKVYRRRRTQKNKLKAFFFPKEEAFHALENTNLKISQGETFVLLGPNGAGKTTLIRILCGLLSPTSGAVFIQGKPVEDAQQKIGLMLGFSMIYYRLTGYDNLKYFAKLYRIKNYKERIEELSDVLELGNWMDEYVEHYSTGMKSKLALARALVHNPDILVLDEPTAGLDIVMSKEIRKGIGAMGKTIILSTHNMAEAEELATRIAFLNRGKVHAVGTPNEIKKSSKLEDVFLDFLKGKIE